MLHACMFVMIHLVCTAVKGHGHAPYHHQSCMCMIAFHIIRIAFIKTMSAMLPWACTYPHFMQTSSLPRHVLWVRVCAWLWPCALPGASSGAPAAGWPACRRFRGLGAGEGLGGVAVPDSGCANAFPSLSTGVVSETRGNFSKRWPSAETGGGPRPLGRAKSKPPFGFQGEFCYSQTI